MGTRPSATIATRVYLPEGTAAAYRLGALYRALEAAGYTTTVLTTKAPGARKSTRHIRRWPVLRDRSGSVRGYLQYASFDIPLFFRLLFGPSADVVVVEPPPTTGVVVRIVCFVRRIPYVYYSADVTSAAVAGIGTSRHIVRVVRMLERASLRGASAVLAVSDGVRHEVIALGANPKDLSVVGTGVDTEKFSIDGPTTRTDYPYFIYAGMMSEFQGAEVFVDGFLEIADRFPNVRLIMFGAGVEVDALTKRSSRLSSRISFPGLVGADEIAKWLRGATAGLVSIRPGAGYDFALPTKALASISCGTPVIYAGPGPLGNHISSESLGWSVDWDAAAVAEAMTSALDPRNTHSSHRLRQWVETNFSLDAVARHAVEAIAATTRTRTHKSPG